MKFKDVATGNVYEFTQQFDIDTMLVHPQYEQVVDKPVEVKVIIKDKE